jgi:hypothetical protein
VRVSDLIALMDKEVVPGEAKVHLASWNGEENPFDVYLAGRFDDWQSWQVKRNFGRPFVVSLIDMPATRQWLYVGVYNCDGCEWHEDFKMYHYRLQARASCSEFSGRLVIDFERPGRQSYLNLDNWVNDLTVCQITRERISIGEFPGFKAVNLTKLQLDVVVRNSYESWRTALSNVSGVYLVSDQKSGKLYVGSAFGEGGIWQRWCQYSACGHAGNVELRRILESEGGLERSNSFRFSILEIADVHATKEETLGRESHWKNALLTREHGLNAN